MYTFTKEQIDQLETSLKTIQQTLIECRAEIAALTARAEAAEAKCARLQKQLDAANLGWA